MLVTTIAGIENVPVGTNLEAVAGRICKVYEYKSGNNANGDWSLQNLTVQDGTGKTTVVLKNRPELTASWQGQDVYFVAGVGKGNRPTGVMVDEYKEKRRIMVNDSAKIEQGEPQQQAPAQQPRQQAPAPRQQQPQQPPRQQQAPRPDYVAEERQEQQNMRQQAPAQQPRQQQAAKTPDEILASTKRDVLQLAALYTICHDAAVLHAASVYSRHGHVQHPASIGALATSFFIEANRKGIGRDLPAAVPTKIPAPAYRMGDIVAAWEEHQAALATSPELSQTHNGNAADTESLERMEEKQW